MEEKKRNGAVIGGWVCFGLGVALMFASLWSFILYGPLFIVAFVLAIVCMAKGRVGQGVVMLLASILVPLVLFVGLGATRTADMAKEIRNAPNAQAAEAAAAKPAEIYRTTAEELFEAYDANEVATEAALKGKVVEITGRVSSIDKDAFGHIVVHLVTPNEFMSAGLTMGDSEAGVAAQLSKGDEVTARCRRVTRVIGSPQGSGCVFAAR